MNQWRVVDLVEYRGLITTRRGCLVVDEVDIPLAEVSCVLLGKDTTWSASVMNVAARSNVALMSCDWRGIPVAASLGWSNNSRVGARHQAQASLTEPRRKNAWMRIVQAKIMGQASNLEDKDAFTAQKLRGLAHRVRSGDQQNYEAQAARMYWGKMFDGSEFTRAPGGGVGANVLLDYGYGVLRGQVIKGVLAAGLIPALGLHHKNRANAYALADDLIEPFRPAVDWVVRQLEPDAWLSDPGVKSSIVALLQLRLGPDGRSVQSETSHLAQLVAQYFEGDTKWLAVPSWDGAGG